MGWCLRSNIQVNEKKPGKFPGLFSFNLVVVKFGEPTTNTPIGWKPGDRMLFLENMGSPKANWKQNSGRLREEMGKKKPIFDSYRDIKSGNQIETGGFLNMERKLLESRGWEYNPKTGAYHPPLEREY